MLAVIVQRKPLISAIFLGSLMYFLFFHVLTANTHASKISYAETDTVSKIPSKNAETYTVGKKESKNEELYDQKYFDYQKGMNEFGLQSKLISFAT